MDFYNNSIASQLTTAQKQRVAPAFRAGYSANIPNPDYDPEQPVDPETNPETIANPQTENEYAIGQLNTFLLQVIRNRVKDYERSLNEPADF